jgi:hypothetical protein
MQYIAECREENVSELSWYQYSNLASIVRGNSDKTYKVIIA